MRVVAGPPIWRGDGSHGVTLPPSKQLRSCLLSFFPFLFFVSLLFCSSLTACNGCLSWSLLSAAFFSFLSCMLRCHGVTAPFLFFSSSVSAPGVMAFIPCCFLSLYATSVTPSHLVFLLCLLHMFSKRERESYATLSFLLSLHQPKTSFLFLVLQLPCNQLHWFSAGLYVELNEC